MSLVSRYRLQFLIAWLAMDARVRWALSSRQIPSVVGLLGQARAMQQMLHPWLVAVLTRRERLAWTLHPPERPAALAEDDMPLAAFDFWELRRWYENEQADAQSVEEVRQRLIERGALPAVLRQRPHPSRVLPGQAGAWQPFSQADHPARRRWSLAQRLTAIAAAVVLLALVGGLTAGLILVRQHPASVSSQATATPGQEPVASPTQAPPHAQALAYIGSDGNVWMMTWPGGTPKQLTTDARGPSTYSGLAWSPDGTLLAFKEAAIGNSNGSLLVMKPDGTLVVKAPLPVDYPDEIPFAWSPDSKMLAFRGDVTIEPSNNGLRKLLLFDAHTGQIVKTLTYEVGGASGCGGGGPIAPLTQQVWLTEHEGFEAPQDAFAWSPDGYSLLFTRRELGSCGRGEGIQIDLSKGTISAPYPFVGSYQPGGNLILGYWHDGTLGLTDLSANHVRALVKPEPHNSSYVIGLGQAVWSSDGQIVYYEHDDGIWRVSVDGSNPRQVVAGTALDSQQNATVQLVPHPSPDGHLLLYFQAIGSNRAVDSGVLTPQPTPTEPLTTRWYVAQADGSNLIPLPQGITEAVWQPDK